ncbi:glycosyltransferase family 4 protein [Colwellia sp. C1TZA3]|uniref:glycosyltransferase family 4 protein n=1 Tax=Colwellia sp. C1TZA3 TaxID=2508879 RepID=UPI001CB960A5|nr:glycosyltransferase family 4 protein [Colwellia sp. C1TZA3]
MSGEPLALYGERPHRVGVLSEMLVDAGHKVTWWTTTFDHQNKKYFYDKYTKVDIKKNLTMRYLHSKVAYRKNISFARINNHKLVAKNFTEVSSSLEKPDLIFCAFPTIDLAYHATSYAVKNDIPVVIDVRDLWPDILLQALPKTFKFIGEFLLSRYFRQTKYIFNNCTAITAVSDNYLQWAIGYTDIDRSDSGHVFPLGYQKNIVSEYDLHASQLKFQDIGLDESKILIWFVGTFGQTYDLNTIIKAARKLKHRDDIQFILTGNGEKMEEWAKLAKGLHNVIFTGWVDKLGLDYLSSVSTIGLMSYKKGAPQGLPNKVFEYLSAGLPILSSLQTETKDLLKNEQVGLTYIAGDVDDFIINLKNLIDNKNLLTSMKEKSTLVFETQYSSSIIYGNMIKYFEKKILKDKIRE